MRARTVASLLLLAGCASSDLPALTARDPASVDAPETPVTSSPIASASAAPSTSAAPAPSGIYRCPMHHEVTSDHPGTCPKCGMTLRLDGDPK